MARHIIRNEDLTQLEKTKAEKERENEAKLRDIYINSDHPNTMENGTATTLWIVIMIISLLFNGGWILCILETVVWWRFINRKNIRAKEWDEKHRK